MLDSFEDLIRTQIDEITTPNSSSHAIQKRGGGAPAVVGPTLCPNLSAIFTPVSRTLTVPTATSALATTSSSDQHHHGGASASVSLHLLHETLCVYVDLDPLISPPAAGGGGSGGAVAEQHCCYDGGLLLSPTPRQLATSVKGGLIAVALRAHDEVALRTPIARPIPDPILPSASTPPAMVGQPAFSSFCASPSSSIGGGVGGGGGSAGIGRNRRIPKSELRLFNKIQIIVVHSPSSCSSSSSLAGPHSEEEEENRANNCYSGGQTGIAASALIEAAVRQGVEAAQAEVYAHLKSALLASIIAEEEEAEAEAEAAAKKKESEEDRRGNNDNSAATTTAKAPNAAASQTTIATTAVGQQPPQCRTNGLVVPITFTLAAGAPTIAGRRGEEEGIGRTPAQSGATTATTTTTATLNERQLLTATIRLPSPIHQNIVMVAVINNKNGGSGGKAVIIVTPHVGVATLLAGVGVGGGHDAEGEAVVVVVDALSWWGRGHTKPCDDAGGDSNARALEQCNGDDTHMTANAGSASSAASSRSNPCRPTATVIGGHVAAPFCGNGGVGGRGARAALRLTSLLITAELILDGVLKGELTHQLLLSAAATATPSAGASSNDHLVNTHNKNHRHVNEGNNNKKEKVDAVKKFVARIFEGKGRGKGCDHRGAEIILKHCNGGDGADADSDARVCYTACIEHVLGRLECIGGGEEEGDGDDSSSVALVARWAKGKLKLIGGSGGPSSPVTTSSSSNARTFGVLEKAQSQLVSLNQQIMLMAAMKKKRNKSKGEEGEDSKTSASPPQQGPTHQQLLLLGSIASLSAATESLVNLRDVSSTVKACRDRLLMMMTASSPREQEQQQQQQQQTQRDRREHDTAATAGGDDDCAISPLILHRMPSLFPSTNNSNSNSGSKNNPLPSIGGGWPLQVMGVVSTDALHRGGGGTVEGDGGSLVAAYLTRHRQQLFAAGRVGPSPTAGADSSGKRKKVAPPQAPDAAAQAASKGCRIVDIGVTRPLLVVAPSSLSPPHTPTAAAAGPLLRATYADVFEPCRSALRAYISRGGRRCSSSDCEEVQHVVLPAVMREGAAATRRRGEGSSVIRKGPSCGEAPATAITPAQFFARCGSAEEGCGSGPTTNTLLASILQGEVGELLLIASAAAVKEEGEGEEEGHGCPHPSSSSRGRKKVYRLTQPLLEAICSLHYNNMQHPPRPPQPQHPSYSLLAGGESSSQTAVMAMATSRLRIAAVAIALLFGGGYVTRAEAYLLGAAAVAGACGGGGNYSTTNINSTKAKASEESPTTRLPLLEWPFLMASAAAVNASGGDGGEEKESDARNTCTHHHRSLLIAPPPMSLLRHLALLFQESLGHCVMVSEATNNILLTHSSSSPTSHHHHPHPSASASCVDVLPCMVEGGLLEVTWDGQIAKEAAGIPKLEGRLLIDGGDNGGDDGSFTACSTNNAASRGSRREEGNIVVSMHQYRKAVDDALSLASQSRRGGGDGDGDDARWPRLSIMSFLQAHKDETVHHHPFLTIAQKMDEALHHVTASFPLVSYNYD